jgi:type IV fimbrial biogenesis protein FimT
MKTSDTRIGMTTSRLKAGGIGFARSDGFTMIELMMTIAIATIVMTLAIPSFRYVTNANRIAGEINGLLGDMQFARAEAIKEGQGVTVCVSTDGATCAAGDTFWHHGWIVISSIANVGVLRVQSRFSGTDTFESTTLSAVTFSTVTFNREGYAGGLPAGTLVTLHDSTNTSAWTRCLSLTFTGQMTTEMVGANSNGSPCT